MCFVLIVAFLAFAAITKIVLSESKSSQYLTKNRAGESMGKAFAEQFAEQYVHNEIVIAIANELFKAMEQGIQWHLNRTEHNISCEHCTYFISGKSVFDYGETNICYSRYGVQEIESEDKVYGLALALQKLIDPILLNLKIPDVTELRLEATKYDLSKYSYTKAKLDLYYTIIQNKFIEL